MAVHMFDVREGKDGSPVKAVTIPAWPILITFPFIVLVWVVWFPVRFSRFLEF